jgi:hypothetical protein
MVQGNSYECYLCYDGVWNEGPSLTDYSVAGHCRVQKLKRSKLPIEISIRLAHAYQGEIVERMTAGPIERL